MKNKLIDIMTLRMQCIAAVIPFLGAFAIIAANVFYIVEKVCDNKQKVMLIALGMYAAAVIIANVLVLNLIPGKPFLCTLIVFYAVGLAGVGWRFLHENEYFRK